MATINEIKAGMTVSFKLHTPLIRDMFTNVKVLGIVNYELASMLSDVAAEHANIYGTLPPGTPELPQDYNYLTIQVPTGERCVVGLPWIKEPVTIVQSTSVRITVHDVSTQDVTKLKDALNSYGYTNLEVEVI